MIHPFEEHTASTLHCLVDPTTLQVLFHAGINQHFQALSKTKSQPDLNLHNQPLS